MNEHPSQKNARSGRKRNPMLNDIILTATIDVLADIGYIGMTMDAVAHQAGTGKATLYRRWDSKSQLVLDAIRHLQNYSPVIPGELPNEATLRDNLLALFSAESEQQMARKLRIMIGIATVMAYDVSFADVGHYVLIRPWADAVKTLLQHSHERGEINLRSVDLNQIATLLPSLSVNRALLERKPADYEFLAGVIDGLILPAVAVESDDQ